MSSVTVCLTALLAAAAPGGRGEVLEFSASWCGPCQQMAPLVARLEREGLPIHSIDVDAHPDLRSRFNVTAMPTFILLIDGREAARKSGPMSEQELRGWISRIPVSSAAPEVAAAAPSRGTSPFVDDGSVRLGAPQAFPAVPSRQADVVAETRPAPRRESTDAPATEPRRGLWPFNALGRSSEQPAESPAPADVRASNAPLVETPDRPPAGDVLMACSVRLRVSIDGKINLGSGTIIDSRDGRSLIVTCGHIFRGFTEGSQIEVNLFEGEREHSHLGRLVKFDLEADVGLVEIDGARDLSAAVVARDIQRANEQESVISIGCSGGQPPTRQDLVVTAVNPYLGPENLECTGIPVQGRSGGGLFRTSGELVGICIAADPARKRGVYAGLKAIHDLLDQTGKGHLHRSVEPPPAVASSGSSAPDPFPTNGAAAEPIGGREGSSLFDSFIPAHAIPTRESSPLAGGAGETPVAGLPGGNVGSPLAVGPGAEDAEIVCIIRPRNQPEAGSQVVIIHQASPKMLSYLRGELGIAPASNPRTAMLSQAQPRFPTSPAAATPAAVGAAEREPFNRPSANLVHRRPDLEATVLTTPFQPRPYVRSR